MSNTPDTRIGVIGTGGMGARHAQNLQRHVVGARVAAVYDLDQQRAGQVATACDGAAVFDDPQHLISDTSLDAIVIAAPDPTHAELARACLRHGKPVLCEKPLATSAHEAAQIVEGECALGRRLIALGFMRRFDPQHVGVRRIVEAGELGRAILFKGIGRNQMIPADLPTETIITNSVIHDLDAVRWMLGQEVEEVFVRGVRSRPSFGDGTLDVLMLQLGMSGDCMASIEATLAVEYGYEIAAEVICERGTVETMQPGAARLRSGRQRMVHVQRDWLERFQSAYVTELQSWVSALREGRTFEGASAWDGYMASYIADACIESLHSGQPVAVAAPERPELYR